MGSGNTQGDIPQTNESSRLKVEEVQLKPDSEPFVWEESPNFSLSDELELAQFEVDGREAELTALKDKAFGRERLEGVVTVEGALSNCKLSVSGVTKEGSSCGGSPQCSAAAVKRDYRLRRGASRAVSLAAGAGAAPPPDLREAEVRARYV